MESSTSAQVEKIVAGTREAFKAGISRDIKFRREQLKMLERMLEDHRKDIEEALEQDTGVGIEAVTLDFQMMIQNLRNVEKNVENWAKADKIHKNWLSLMDKLYISKVPFGVVLICVQSGHFPLEFNVICGAIAAGNCVVMRFDLSSKMAAIWTKLVPLYLNTSCYHVITGESVEAMEILNENFDFVYFKGSKNLGKQISGRAGQRLIPSCVILNGKCPVYIDDNVDMTKTVERILWGKLREMGQNSLAPDYILCSKKMEEIFIQGACTILNRWYGLDWKLSKDLGRILTTQKFDQLSTYVTNSGMVAVGGEIDRKSSWIQPTILTQVKVTDPIMKEEIFGPILPILNCNSPAQALNLISSIAPDPLALYVFTTSSSVRNYFENNSACGSLMFNDTVSPLAYDQLPLSGFGESGMGSNGIKFSFDTFTHNRSCVKRDYSLLGELTGYARYPPYQEFKIKVLSFLLNHWKKFAICYFDYLPQFSCFLFGVAVALYLF